MKTYNDRNIKDILQDFVSNHKRIERGVTNVNLRKIWDAAMGQMIAGYTRDMKFYEGVLTIYLTSAPLRHELSMSTKQIITILNEGIGEKLIIKVVLR